MTHMNRWCWAMVITACALLAPAPARAQLQAKIGGTATGESLTSQEKEMLALAIELSKRCGDTLERWMATKEVSQERLFNSLYYPIPKTDPPKFTTDWDTLSDRDVLALEEGVLGRSSAINYAVLSDKNGYIPTHNQRFSQPLTGNPATDLVNNRTKRIYSDRTGLTGVRSLAPFIIQRYQSDSGEVMADLAVPVYVRGAHWGAVRIGYRAAEGR